MTSPQVKRILTVKKKIALATMLNCTTKKDQSRNIRTITRKDLDVNVNVVLIFLIAYTIYLIVGDIDINIKIHIYYVSTCTLGKTLSSFASSQHGIISSIIIIR